MRIVKTATLKGFKFRLFGWNFRIWNKGFEIGNKFGGRVYLFPWSKK